MQTISTPRRTSVRRAAVRCCLAAVTLASPVVVAGPAAAHAIDPGPTVTVEDGEIRGTSDGGVRSFRGVPYAAAPTGRLRWRAPQPPARWRGVRDASAAAANCPQPETPYTPGRTDEDCLYLNVSAPAMPRGGSRPVLVWIHGGGFTLGAGQDYDPTELARAGTVVVTINYRLGALGFLAHPALAEQEGAPTGNYGLMDQQAALRWVHRNIASFGGDPRNVTIAGQSAGGLSVLFQLISPGARGLFQRAIVQSGSFAPRQRSLADAESDGRALAAAAGCGDQSPECLRALPAAELGKARFAGIPGVVDGKVLRESVGSALASGRFHRVPLINGSNHDEERLFLALGSTVSGGYSAPLPEPITPESYERVIASAFKVDAGRAAAIASKYPISTYGSAPVAFSQLDTDANFACTALEQNLATARYVPTYAYELNDDNAPERFVPQLAAPPKATHQSELQYLFDLPHAPFPAAFSREQTALAGSIRKAWARFADTGDPGSRWPRFDARHRRTLSLVTPKPEVVADFATKHRCDFWAQAR